MSVGTGNTRDLLGLLRNLIAQETRYLRHYLAQVRDSSDPLTRGRVLVHVPELGWSTDATGAWCWPRDRHSMDVPKVGEWVEVYFMGGDPARPVYLGQAAELNGQAPADFDGRKRVVLQDPDSGDALSYDPGAGLLLLGDSKKLVTHTELNSALQGFVSALNTLFGTKLDGGGTIGTLSLDISAAEAVKLRTS